MKRLIDDDSPGDMEQRAARPAGRVQGGKLVGVRCDDPLEKIGLHERLPLGDRRGKRLEDHAPGGPFRRQMLLDGAAVQRRELPAQVDALGQQRRQPARLPGGVRLGKPEPVETEPPQVRAPPVLALGVGQRQRLKRPPRVMPEIGQPRGLAPRIKEFLKTRRRDTCGNSQITHCTSTFPRPAARIPAGQQAA